MTEILFDELNNIHMIDHRFIYTIICFYMKTTLDLNERLHARAKSAAAKLRIPLTRFIEEAVRQRLDAATNTTPAKPFKVTPFKLKLKPAYQGVSLNQFYDQVEAEDQKRKLQGG